MAIRISQIIDSEAAVRDFLKKIAIDIESANSDESFIAVDTEFIRENSDVPLLCLIQIATHTQCFVVDPFAIDISFLNDIFANESILKVFHSATQDIDVLYHANIGVKNVYDTQLYEMLLSTKEFISYKSIVAKYLNRTLNKNYVISDWSKRPLSKKQLQYAVGDVIHLREVYKLQIQKLHDVKRENWLQSEMKQLENLGRELISDKKNAEITKQLLRGLKIGHVSEILIHKALLMNGQ
ncbi:MAG: ribonuclease D [Alphaproteobacteria bacterium]|nr:ribonuclease D [Alphaproteobacteria bacterium]